ncbi:hypothetical protein L218DRAFT_551670 [Marasmius fiardii PR-910]|nr:hypothetical protein L218DRAFT_551670 [Marasmius fiardii PR-910]
MDSNRTNGMLRLSDVSNIDDIFWTTTYYQRWSYWALWASRIPMLLLTKWVLYANDFSYKYPQVRISTPSLHQLKCTNPPMTSKDSSQPPQKPLASDQPKGPQKSGTSSGVLSHNSTTPSFVNHGRDQNVNTGPGNFHVYPDQKDGNRLQQTSQGRGRS